MSTPTRMNRRRFIQLGLAGLASVPTASVVVRHASAADADAPLVDENDPAAVAIGYVHDAEKVDVSRFPKRAGESGGTQFCHNCALYQGQGTEGVGPCSVFPGRNVKAAGWCNAWVPAPNKG